MGKKIGIIIDFLFWPDKEYALIERISLSPEKFNGRVRYGIKGEDKQLSFEELAQELKKIQLKRDDKIYLFVVNQETGKRKDFSLNIIKEWPNKDMVDIKYNRIHEIYHITEHIKEIGVL
jgi:hypothetical protein